MQDKSLRLSRYRTLLYSMMHSNVLVLYIVPIFMFCIGNFLLSNKCFAATGTATNASATDVGTISPISGDTSTPPTASLTLSNSSMTSNSVTPGNTATTSTNVTVNVSNASSYSLTLSFAKTTLTGTTTINAGNAVSDNTWGYKWDTASTYSTPTTTGTNLTVPALSNDSANFTKTLAFAAKFATNAEAGHYTNTGTLSLVASPKAATYTLADLTQMQQLAEGYAPDACRNTVIPSGQDYAGPYTLTDVRDNNTYTVYKFKDNKCWMTENLKLSDTNAGNPLVFNGRILKKETSDITADTWTLPVSSISGFFSDYAAINTYYNPNSNTGYYTWCAATAGTCTSATSSGQEAPSSICPKGWRLPTGDSKANEDFRDLYNSISGVSKEKLQGSPYNFAPIGYVWNSELKDASTRGFWWSRIALDSERADRFYVGSGVYPEFVNLRDRGFAVRCIAQ